MSSVNVMKHYLQRLPFLVKTGSLIEDMLGEKLYQEIEKLIAQHFNCSVQNMTWEVIRWDVSENFEYKEIWFFPRQWLAVDVEDVANELQTEISYAYFKLTIKNDVKQEQYVHEGSFVKNTNRFPMINFFQHDYGFVCIQFHLNWKVLKKKLRTPEQRYVELKNWHKFVLDVLTEYPMLNDLGFQTGESYCYLKIAQLDVETVAEKFEQGMLQDALEPIGDALHTVSKAFSVFEQIQQQARCYIEKVISKPEEKIMLGEIYWDSLPAKVTRVVQNDNEIFILFEGKINGYGRVQSGRIVLKKTTELQLVHGVVEYQDGSGRFHLDYIIEGAFDDETYELFSGNWREADECYQFDVLLELEEQDLCVEEDSNKDELPINQEETTTFTEEAVCLEELVEVEPNFEDEQSLNNVPRLGSNRQRATRGDARVRTIQRKMELYYGLPEGSVKLINPDRSIIHPSAKIRTLRERWTFDE